MKRLLLLLVLLAIAVAMASSTLAVYTLTLTSEQSNIGNKVFDLFASPPYQVTEPRSMEDAQTWRFKVFTKGHANKRVNLCVKVTLNTPATNNLTVHLLDSTGEEMTPPSPVAFLGSSSVTLIVTDYIKNGNHQADEILSLSFSYDAGFPADSVYYTVEAYMVE